MLPAERSASAPPTISMISVVIASWRARFMTRLRVLMSSSAFSVAADMARWRAACSEAEAFKQRGVDRGLDVLRDEPSQQLLGVGLELEVAEPSPLAREVDGSLGLGPRSLPPPRP